MVASNGSRVPLSGPMSVYWCEVVLLLLEPIVQPHFHYRPHLVPAVCFHQTLPTLAAAALETRAAVRSRPCLDGFDKVPPRLKVVAGHHDEVARLAAHAVGEPGNDAAAGGTALVVPEQPKLHLVAV